MMLARCPDAEIGARAELQRLYHAYVNLLEIGRDRIISAGGSCDPVDRMEEGDPTLVRVRAFLAEPEALALPGEMTLAIKDVLSLMLWHSGELARAYRAGGHTIPNKAEEEQAFVLWRLLRFAIEQGDNWRKCVQADLAQNLSAAKSEAPRS